jgi:ribosomal protein L24E
MTANLYRIKKFRSLSISNHDDPARVKWAIAYRDTAYFIITENHCGEMDVFSEPGKGTRFVIRLPLQKTG